MSDGGQRIDKWMWYARIFKSRTAAGKFVAAGKVRVNRVRVTKPGHSLVPGDVLTFTLHHRLRIVEVLDPGTRRGPAAEARLLYEDLSPPPEAKTDTPCTPVSPGVRDQGTGRPTKKERRELDAWLEPEK